jgi:hypothetical protein
MVMSGKIEVNFTLCSVNKVDWPIKVLVSMMKALVSKTKRDRIFI